jgi:hypothetical protein
MTSLILSLCLMTLADTCSCANPGTCETCKVCSCDNCLMLCRADAPPAMPVDKWEWRQEREGEQYLYKNGTCVGGYNFASKVYMTWEAKAGWNATPAKCPVEPPAAPTTAVYSPAPYGYYLTDPSSSGGGCANGSCSSGGTGRMGLFGRRR